jgi:hypothetical protein
MSNIHINAKALILEAAGKSGLLREVAELLWFANKQALVGPALVQALREQLTDAFDAHTSVSALSWLKELYECEGLPRSSEVGTRSTSLAEPTAGCNTAPDWICCALSH